MSAVVTQADRERAAKTSHLLFATFDSNEIENGKKDNSSLVQAFALHRSEAVEELVEVLSRYVSCCGNTAAMLDRESVQEAWRLARAALAKHRGEQG